MRKQVLYRNLLFCAVFISTLGASLQAQSKKERQKSRKEYYDALQVTGSIISGVQRYFVDTVDLPHLHALGMNAMLQRLDPYTEYMTPERAKSFREATSGTYAGIGAVINQRPDKKVVINEPMQGQPADQAGLMTGDWIQEINGKDFRYSSSTAVSKALRGEEGTKIVLQILRRGETKPRVMTFQRKKISMNSIAYAAMLEEGVGYISLSSFTTDSAEEFLEALKDLQAKGMKKALVLDLRNNGGGVLQSAIKILGYFLPKGTKVLDIKGRDAGSNASYTTEEEPVAKDLPLVVMINYSSASASEIVSGALQDYDRALIVGEKSYGKGLVQSTVATPNRGLFKLTTARYYIPSGRSIQKINYDHLGSAKAIAKDSLGTPFKTRNGRIVYAAGGITPDVDLSADTLASIVSYMAIDTLVNDYAVDYVLSKKSSLSSPDRFSLSEEEYNAFIQYLAKKKFTYKTVSEHYLDRFENVYKQERLEQVAKEELEALRKALQPNIIRDGKLFKEDIKQFMEGLIVRIRYYRKGYFQYLLPKDRQIKSVIQLINDKKKFQDLLRPVVAKK